MLAKIWCAHFCAKIYFILALVQNFRFWFSSFRNSWMKIISKDLCTFTSLFIAIYMGPCRKSYILLVRKFWTSEILDKWSPRSNLSDIKLSHIPNGQYIFFTCTRTHLSPYLFNLFFDILKSFPIFVIIELWVLDIMSALQI